MSKFQTNPRNERFSKTQNTAHTCKTLEGAYIHMKKSTHRGKFLSENIYNIININRIKFLHKIYIHKS